MDTWVAPPSTAKSILIKPRSNLEEWLEDIDVKFPDSEEVCWICLDGDTAGHQGDQLLMTPCKCPRKVHPSCLARWQLQQVGSTEETHCRFCNHALKDWKAEMTPESLRNELEAVTPIMVVYFEGEIHRIPVLPGEDGLKEFESHIRKLFRLPEDVEISLTFGCKAPLTGMHLKLEGARSYNAAVHCAKVAAADRMYKLKNPPPSIPTATSSNTKNVAAAVAAPAEVPHTSEPMPNGDSAVTIPPKGVPEQAGTAPPTTRWCPHLPRRTYEAAPGPGPLQPLKLAATGPGPLPPPMSENLIKLAATVQTTHALGLGPTHPDRLSVTSHSSCISRKEMAVMTGSRSRAVKSWQQSSILDQLRADQAAMDAAAVQRAELCAQHRREASAEHNGGEQQPLRVGPSSSGGAADVQAGAAAGLADVKGGDDVVKDVGQGLAPLPVKRKRSEGGCLIM